MRVQQAARWEDWLAKELEDPRFRRAYDREGLRVHLAYQLLCLREDAGLTQAQLAKRMSTTQQVISRLESGKYQGITLRTLQRLAEAVEGELVVEIRAGKTRAPTRGRKSAERQRRRAG